MPTECTPKRFEFEAVARRAVLRSDCEALAGKSTLNRLEHTPKRHGTKYHKIDCDGAKVDALLVDLFVEAHERAPREIVIDLDNTDIPLYGMQEGRFFHGYYDDYCYLPLYAFCGRHLLLARQRRANVAGSPQVAQGAHCAARRLGLCQRGADGVVRGEPSVTFSAWRATPAWRQRWLPNWPRPVPAS